MGIFQSLWTSCVSRLGHRGTYEPLLPSKKTIPNGQKTGAPVTNESSASIYGQSLHNTDGEGSASSRGPRRRPTTFVDSSDNTTKST
jgi:hypothetical protein